MVPRNGELRPQSEYTGAYGEGWNSRRGKRCGDLDELQCVLATPSLVPRIAEVITSGALPVS
jgi:hypothetical protein